MRRELGLEAAITKLDKYQLLILDDIAYVTKDQADKSQNEIGNKAGGISNESLQVNFQRAIVGCGKRWGNENETWDCNRRCCSGLRCAGIRNSRDPGMGCDGDL